MSEATQRVEFHTGTTRLDISMTDDGELEIYASDGVLWTRSHSANVVRVRAEPAWPDKTMSQIVERQIAMGVRAGDTAIQIAQSIVAIMRGRKR